MATAGVVKKPFPYARDGFTIEQLKEGDVLSFPDLIFGGLKDGGYIDATSKKPADYAGDRDGILDELDYRIISSLNQRLAGLSDDELKAIVARSGQPYAGPLVHADLIAAAKLQMAQETEGVSPLAPGAADDSPDTDAIPADWRDQHHTKLIQWAKRFDSGVKTKAEAIEVLGKAEEAGTLNQPGPSA